MPANLLPKLIHPLFISVLTAFIPSLSLAEPCGDNPQSLGTARTIEVSASTTPRVGLKHFPTTLPLRPKEIVLTFDDGPWPTTTPQILEALKHECVKATFFLLGRNVARFPELARRELDEGHSLGHHTLKHRLLNRIPLKRALAEIEQGIETNEFALYGQRRVRPTTPFFRFPGFAANAPLLKYLNERELIVFGTDVWASDWRAMTPEQELRLVLSRIEKIDRGIILLHDTKRQTAQMLPRFLRELKNRGYQIVHVVAATRTENAVPSPPPSPPPSPLP